MDPSGCFTPQKNQSDSIFGISKAFLASNMTKAKHQMTRSSVLEGVAARHIKWQKMKSLKEQFEDDG
eukprot:315019-Ditylum_brightwellii.AAC.1